MNTFIPPFRLGKKSCRAVLDSLGHTVVIFPKGRESIANQYVELINEDLKSYDNNMTAGDISKKFNVPVGVIGCPHCGITSYGAIDSSICQMCGLDYFKK